METGLRDKAVLVTGASRGIGNAIARAFTAEGARVAATYHSHREPAEEAGELAVQLDLTRPETVADVVAAVIEQLGGLDVLVVNASRQPAVFHDHLEDQPAEELEEQVRFTLESTFKLVSAALPSLRKAGTGRIVFMSSGVAEEGFPRFWEYATVKAGLAGLVRTLAWDAGRDGVLVNAISTGLTLTDATLSRLDEAALEGIARQLPQQRISRPEDVARLAVFLGSAANTSVTGEVIRDGTSNARTSLVVMNTDDLREQ
ncbi:SDR family NAD(P)-dependent oxidoreductase [Amycolatopsis pithecellobii]|uniref:SDR family oxidoreductase n=1 Tax=Amycolatopsis pithecellobii TaxID=664692 RepID=A0A6N7YNA4_9PSEU|nr:SDR family oxidoreductase [Amycolatopsis pithecellobii]MTD54455.1 SDR family oxidoreductase [Amycolatopsis pithecellobii]